MLSSEAFMENVNTTASNDRGDGEDGAGTVGQCLSFYLSVFEVKLFPHYKFTRVQVLCSLSDRNDQQY